MRRGWLQRREAGCIPIRPPAIAEVDGDRRRTHTARFRRCPGRQFEQTIARLLRDRGFTEVQIVGGPGDHGVDITCRDNERRLVAVQCKRYSIISKVASKEMQLFVGMAAAHHHAERAIYVTTSTFTPAAIDLARHHQVELVLGADIRLLLIGPNSIMSASIRPMSPRPMTLRMTRCARSTSRPMATAGTTRDRDDEGGDDAGGGRRGRLGPGDSDDQE